MKNNLLTIAAHLPFAETLAGWVLERWGDEPLMLSRALILVPSRRTAMSLREAFLRVSEGRPLLLPRIEPLGDAEEDALLASTLAHLLPLDMPSETFAFRRLFLLARLAQREGRMDHALKLAVPLAALLDELEREEISLDGMGQIVPDAFAAHWQETVEFLRILSLHWPDIAREDGLISPGNYNARVLKALAAHWQATPPCAPVVAAGTTGSVPATAALLKAIASLPQGHIVLPGLDLAADDAYFDAVAEGHPQWGMAQLLKKLGQGRDSVRPIGEPDNMRMRLMSEVMRPAEVSDARLAADVNMQAALGGLHSISCDHPQEEATVIALLLREALEAPGMTAALVTPNRPLARRVAAIMQRFGVTIDDSAGVPLAQMPLMAFFRLAVEASLSGFAPLPFLSLLKHPLARVGLERMECLETAREIERLALRGLWGGEGLEAIRQMLLKKPEASRRTHLLLDRLEDAYALLTALAARKEALLSELVQAHLACVEAIAGEQLWEGAEAEEAGKFFRELRAACAFEELPVEVRAYPAAFEELLAGRVYRPEYGMHPRLKILSPMEARMQSFDRLILGGLNEGSWPPAPMSDPWFNRPMRMALGLPAPERKLGLAAHDFFMLACGPEVYLTRALKEDGTPTTSSRWLARLEMLAGGLPVSTTDWIGWARMLDTPQVIAPVRRPAPKPPLAARPQGLSVTQVDTWMRDPYALYAAQVLRLRAFEALGREPGPSDFGNAAHKALEQFVRRCPRELPADALNLLLQCGREAFAELFAGSGIETLWWPRFMRIAEWIIEREEERRPMLAQVAAEVEGSCRFDGFLLRGRADRIEEGRDGSLSIVDYKTGQVPKDKDIEAGLSNQLVLLALIAAEGKEKAPFIMLEYWRLLGREESGKIASLKADKIDGYMEGAREGLLQLIHRYRDPSFPYLSTPVASRASGYSDYDHLARVKEWG